MKRLLLLSLLFASIGALDAAHRDSVITIKSDGNHITTFDKHPETHGYMVNTAHHDPIVVRKPNSDHVLVFDGSTVHSDFISVRRDSIRSISDSRDNVLNMHPVPSHYTLALNTAYRDSAMALGQDNDDQALTPNRRPMSRSYTTMRNAANRDSIMVVKPNGDRVITIKRTDTSGAYILSVGGFDLLMGGSVDNYEVADGYASISSSRTTLNNSVVLTTQTNPTPDKSILCACGCGKAGCACSYKCSCGCGSHTCQCGRTKAMAASPTPPSAHIASKKKPTEKRSRYAIGLQFGFLSLDGDDDILKLDHGRSISIGMALKRQHALDKNRTVWFASGIRARWDNYVMRNHTALRRADGHIAPYPIDLNANPDYKKSKLGVFSIDIPVSWEFRIARIVRLETGVYGGIRLGDRTKIKFPKHKDKGDWMTQFWQAGITANLKIKPLPFGIYGNYSLTPLFEKGATPRMQPYTIGIYW